MTKATTADEPTPNKLILLNTAKKMLLNASAALPTNESIFEASRHVQHQITKIEQGDKWGNVLAAMGKIQGKGSTRTATGLRMLCSRSWVRFRSRSPNPRVYVAVFMWTSKFPFDET